MIYLYYTAVFLFLVVACPYLLLSAKRRAGLLQKLGFIPAEFRSRISGAHAQPGKPTIWFHAVSVGEFNGALPLVREFARRNPQYRLFVSTATAAGQALAKERLGNSATTFYFPLDLPFAISSWLDLIKPSLVIIVETEIWPGFTYECKLRGIQLAMVNARMSPRSFSKYMTLRGLFSQVVNRFDLIATQSQEESQRFQQICGSRSAAKIEKTGNLKYDRLQLLTPSEITQLRIQLNLKDTDRVILAGSTHEGEESALLEVYRKLQEASKNPVAHRLILAPRHPERWEKVCRLLESQGFTACRYSQGVAFKSSNDVYVLDTIGQLARYYAIASVAFVGGSLVQVGGHNLVEPFVYSVPAVCGPHLFKTLDVARQLETAGALTIVHDVGQLHAALSKLLDEDGSRQQRGTAGNEWLKHSQGAIAHTVELLERALMDNESLQGKGISHSTAVEVPAVQAP